MACILLCHWLGDFVCQTRWMALNKSKNSGVLGLHVLIYSTVLLGGAALIFGPHVGWLAVLCLVGANALLHFATDAVSSRIGGYFWHSQQQTYFWWTLGFDQFVHVATLLCLLEVFIGSAPSFPTWLMCR